MRGNTENKSTEIKCHKGIKTENNEAKDKRLVYSRCYTALDEFSLIYTRMWRCIHCWRTPLSPVEKAQPFTWNPSRSVGAFLRQPVSLPKLGVPASSQTSHPKNSQSWITCSATSADVWQIRMAESSLPSSASSSTTKKNPEKHTEMSIGQRSPLASDH